MRLNWNNYTHTADIGECCQEKLFEQINFRKRMTAKEYQESRRQKANSTTLRRKKTEASNGA